MIILLKTVQTQVQKKQSELIQQMFNLEEDKTALKVLAVNAYDDLIMINSDETIDLLNL